MIERVGSFYCGGFICGAWSVTSRFPGTQNRSESRRFPSYILMLWALGKDRWKRWFQGTAPHSGLSQEAKRAMRGLTSYPGVWGLTVGGTWEHRLLSPQSSPRAVRGAQQQRPG